MFRLVCLCVALLAVVSDHIAVSAFQNAFAVRTSASPLSAATSSDVDASIAEVMPLLYNAAETKSEDGDAVVAALLDLEKLMRQKNKEDPSTEFDQS